jgi:phenylalanyl-tRNA synthetase beta subunit
MHSEAKLEVEAVKVHYNSTEFTPLLKTDIDVVPHLETREMSVTMKYIRTIVGVDLTAQQAIEYLHKMSIIALAIDQENLMC